MKKPYIQPEVNVTVLVSEDIITLSANGAVQTNKKIVSIDITSIDF